MGLMPKLHGIRERLPLNIYDSFPPRDGEIRLFGNTNIGQITRTNLLVAGLAVATDQEAVIKNWYARTNITPDAFQQAWRAWTEATLVTFVLGMSPITQLPLADLLRRQQGQGTDEPWNDAAACECLAEKLRDSYHHGAQPWPEAPLEYRLRWMGVARKAMLETRAPVLATVPLRQTFSVRVASDQRAQRALLEVLPTNVAPMSLVWIHLEGEAVRDYQPMKS
jgi:hypothetical protein